MCGFAQLRAQLSAFVLTITPNYLNKLNKTTDAPPAQALRRKRQANK
jgi:hypothetical protein